ncbi:MAG: moaA 3 [Bryobacterales bacterium]|nr:moaA 3 [Bryobacterales bacterium]
MKLNDKAHFGFGAKAFIGLLEARAADGNYALRNLSIDDPKRLTLRIGSSGSPADVSLSEEMAYLRAGDMLRLNPQTNDIRVLYRGSSRHNFLFLTERCNSRCLMCSQPPRSIDDSYLADDILRMIPWMAKDTRELGITGGEPTLLHDRLTALLGAVKEHLPSTALHMLSNGRLFSYLRYAERVAEAKPADFMVGVPLYADTASAHDFVVQASGAFEETLFGLLNLARVGVRVELRMVVHRHTYARLPQFAQFVARNLPFVDQVVIMGLELMGYARSNLDSLWIDPVEYQDELERCVHHLDQAGLNVFIYNHQLCLLRPSLRRFAKKSISDWKNIYLPECDGCTLKTECGGFFASATLRHSSHIHSIR